MNIKLAQILLLTMDFFDYLQWSFMTDIHQKTKINGIVAFEFTPYGHLSMHQMIFISNN